MSRGRLPELAQKTADPVARDRGLVQHYQYEPGAIFSFTIFSRGRTDHVRIKCVRRLAITVQEIERDLVSELAAIRMTASGLELSRELWLCSPRYALRFFRVTDTGLIEIGRDGLALQNGISSATTSPPAPALPAAPKVPTVPGTPGSTGTGQDPIF